MAGCLHCPNREVNARNLASGKMKARVKILNSVVFAPSSPANLKVSNAISAKAKFANFGGEERRKTQARRRAFVGRVLCPPNPYVSATTSSSTTNNNNTPNVGPSYTSSPTLDLRYGGSTQLFGASSKATPYQSGLNRIEITSREVLKVGDTIDVNPDFFNKPIMKITQVTRSARPSAYYRKYKKLYKSDSTNITSKDGYQWLGGYGFSTSNSIYVASSGGAYDYARVTNASPGFYVSSTETISLSRNINSFPLILRKGNFAYRVDSEGGNGVDGDVDDYVHYSDPETAISALPIVTTTAAPTTTTAAPITPTPTPSAIVVTTTAAPSIVQTTTEAPTTTPPTTAPPVTTTAAPYSPGYGYDIGPRFGAHNASAYHLDDPDIGKTPEYTYTVIIDGYALNCVDGNLEFESDVEEGANLRASNTVIHGIKYPKTKLTQLSVKSRYIFEAGISQRVKDESHVKTGYVDRFGGHLSKYKSYDNFEPVERLYPSGDLITASGGISFINESGAAHDLYKSIDEGIFTGNYLKEPSRVSDDLSSYIMPSAILTKGNFKYKLEVTAPSRSMSESFLVIRASAPMQTYTSELPPVYTLSNLRLEDPSGNLITQYKDIVIRGDAKYNNLNYKNFATYFSEPEINHANLKTYADTYPIFGEASGYTLNIDINAGCLDDPFSQGFSFGFEDTCVPEFIIDNGGSGVNNYLAMAGAPIGAHGESAPFIGVPTNNLRISAIEILSSGGLLGYKSEFHLGLISEIPTTGLRGRRDIFPVEILSHDFDTTLYPSENTLWSGVNNLTNEADHALLTQTIRNDDEEDYLEMLSTSSVADSGKLKLRFSHETPILNLQLADGAFSFGSYEKGLRAAKERLVAEVDSFFVVDDIQLKITAKKAAGTRDYVLDVVGYSDDKLLHITPKIGGFLQNASGLHPSGIGIHPVSSGFSATDEFGISSEAISDKFEYFETSGTNNLGGDHYSLPAGPLVSGLGFQEYTIPLKIYTDKRGFGPINDVNYSMSTFFENLFLDIFPFPSGAMVSHIALSFTYGPSQALAMATLGHSVQNTVIQGKPKLFPVSTQEFSSKLNASFPISSGLSLIEQIPQGYKTPTSNVTLKTNYSRRWRGVDGNIVNGPFDPNVYDYSFYNPEAETPFLSGFYSFNRTQDNFVLSEPQGAKLAGANSGEFNGDLNASIIDSLGFRLNTSGMFPSTQQRTYKTIDWTPADHELNGRILDSFDRAIRVSGNLGNIDFGSGIPVSSGFSAYVRFSPDITISGSSYNFWNSGVLLSKWDAGAGLEFTLGYSGGFLCGRATASGGNNIYIQDTQDYTNYQYPLSALLTYNDSLSSGLKLYVDSEIDSGNHNILRASSDAFAMSGGNSNIVAGYSSGSGVGINAFFTEVGISCYNASGSHIVENGNLKSMQQTTADSFFNQHRVKFWNSGEAYTNDDYNLWSFVDEDVDKWHIGAFSVCQFNQAYDRLYTRIGSDFINYNLTHDGSGYEQKTNTAFPTDIILSGVAYHTQIENDMLRFNIGAVEEDGSAKSLYSAAPRIAKDFPRGYKFNERSFVVETIIQHFTNQPLVWPDNASGAKLMVSLYAPHKDVINLTSGNYGLINRHTHYLPQSGCWEKISSTFDYNDWIDRSEPWSNFDVNTAQQKFDHEYYSDDVEKMFIQYDLSYPSGTAFDSNLKLHSINLKLENAVTSGAALNSTDFTLYSSGYIGDNIATTLQVIGHETVSGTFSGSGLSLTFPNVVTNQVSGVDPSGMLLAMPFAYASGPDVTSSGQLGLMTSGDGTIGFNPDLVSYGDGMFGFVNQTGVNPVVNMSIVGKPVTEPDFGDDMSLYVSNTDPLPQALEQVNFFMPVDGTPETYQTVFSSFFTHGIAPVTYNLSASAPLYVSAPLPEPILKESMNMSVSGSVILPSASGTTTLFTQNYPLLIAAEQGKLQSINWTSENTGSGLLVSEEGYAYLEANDEIRGVDMICYGSCDTGFEKCDEAVVDVHGERFGGECVEGGILRAKRLYTNLATSGFKTDVGYSGNYYGIRKFVGLIPDSPYIVNIFGQTGTNERKALPKSASVEYGINGEVNFSGIKIVADGIAGASGVTSLASDSNRHVGDKFGKAMVVKGDYMLVGSPHHHIKDESDYDLGEAGSIFVYKREPEPTGYNWDYHKAGWSLDTKLTLPSGHRRDYKVTTSTKFTEKLGELPFTANESQWHVGQEGRQLGHSLDMSSSGTNPVIVAGAPNAKWTRTFDDPPVSGVDVALLIFTRKLTGFQEEFYVENTNPWLRRKTVYNVIEEVTNNNLLYKYFCNPSVELNAKVIVIEPISDSAFPNNPILDTSTSDILFKFPIHNMDGNYPHSNAEQQAIILEQIKQIFNGPASGVYQYDASKRNNGIPAIVGCLIDNSESMGEARALGNAIVEFEKWLVGDEETIGYSQASGVVNIYGEPDSTYFVKEYDNRGVNWVTQGTNLVESVLDTGVVFTSDKAKSLFADNLGTFRSDIDAFNISPASGGSVFIFQEGMNNGIKEWNTIQEIKSPTAKPLTDVDRFGHAVAISDDAQVIIIGSPYMQNPIQVYSYDKYVNPVNSVGTWINRIGPDYKPLPGMPNGYIYNTYLRYTELNSSLGSNVANQTVYDELSASGKLQLVKDENIEQYKLTKTFTYGDFQPAGRWNWLYSKFVPTSRLGYSVAVNEDGSMFAAGAPTDSVLHEEFNDFNLWWRPAATHSHHWYSSVNAGSVRVFESREYYPHNNKVVEFTKFGNFHRTINFENNETLFDHMTALYAANGKTFTRLPEDEVDIPNDAGLAFIISPEIDALSDEILDNIQNWLALGDRHLVIVGDDPVYEEDGLYAETNDIVNDLLSKLDSRMRIYEASGDYAALMGSNRQDGQAFSKNDTNITTAFVPKGTTSAVSARVDLYGSGVGNIKLFYPGANQSYTCEEVKDDFFSPELDAILGKERLSYQDINSNCNIPIRHQGDMRSQWNEMCTDINGKPLIYPVNLALFFGTQTQVGYGCDPASAPTPDTSKATYEPIPLLTSAEHIIERRFVPAIPDSIQEVPVYHIVQKTVGQTFKEVAESGAAFYWSSTGNNYNYLQENIQPTFDVNSYDTADHPDIPEFTERTGRTSILRAEAKVESGSRNEPTNLGGFIPVAKENYKQTTSQVYLIGTTKTENLTWLSRGVSTQGRGDNNLRFYRNMLQGVERLGQLGTMNGSFTGRDSFVSADSQSYFSQRNGPLIFDVPSVSENIQIISDQFDALWIASTHENIDDISLRQLETWLSKGNRKLFITIGKGQSDSVDQEFSTTQGGLKKSRDVATDLCNKLGLNIKPLYLENKDKYADSSDFRNKFSFPEYFVIEQELVGEYIDGSVIESTRWGRVNRDSGSENYNKAVTARSNESFIFYNEGTAIDTRNGGVALVYTNDSANQLVDDNFVVYGVPHIRTGVAKVNFPVIGGSGYRFFFDSIATNRKQMQRHQYQIANCTRTYGNNEASGSLIDIKDIDARKSNTTYNSLIQIRNYDVSNSYLKDFVGVNIPKNTALISNAELERKKLRSEYYTDGELMHEHMDIYVPTGIDNISIYINANKINDIEDAPFTYVPETSNIVGISGALLGSTAIVTGVQELLRVDEVVIPGSPERIDETSRYRPISTRSLKYCPTIECRELFEEKDRLHEIEDGPMVAAQEVYHQREFTAGVNRSRITVLSDASMIQGPMIANDELVIHDNVRYFLQSLYPETDFPEEYQGKQYNIISRITAPVKGSPHKFFNATGDSGNMIRFAGDGTPALSGRAMTFFSDTLDRTTIVSKTGKPKSVLDVDIGKGAEYLLIDEPPYPDAEMVLRIQSGIIASFDADQYNYGGTSKFSGIVDGKMYGDAFYGQVPKLLAEKDIDYLDFDKLPSGYPGDLFGYSIALRENQLIVGQPFGAFADERAENPINWAYVSGNTQQYTPISGAIIGYGGGAGSAYLYDRGERVLSDYGVEKQSKPWTLNQKFRPSSINVGQDLCLDKIDETALSSDKFRLANNIYTITELAEQSFVTDQFGLSVDLYEDLVAIGAPGHDFANFEEVIFSQGPTSSGAFNLKEFSDGVDIPERNVYDLGESGVRADFENSGILSVLNAGAAYLYENAIIDWDNRIKGWKFNEKLVAKGHNARIQRSEVGGSSEVKISGCEFDYFGRVISIHQQPRVDSNYAIAIGVPNHQYGTSGNHISFNHGSGINAGAVYQYDVILRKPEDSVANSGITLEAKVYGSSGIDRSRDDGIAPYNYVPLNFSNSGQYSKTHQNSGLIYSNNEGEIFLEVSGQDPSSRGFITHRPFIQQITGKYFFGVPETGLLRLYNSGRGELASGSMPLFNQADSGAMVYNNLGMYASAALGSVSGAFSGSGLSLTVYNDVSGIFNSGLTLVGSGGPIIDNNIFLRVRGK